MSAETSLNVLLARAIGYGVDEVCVDRTSDRCYVLRLSRDTERNAWFWFDYRHAATIWPIAEAYDAFPFLMDGSWATTHARGYSCPKLVVLREVLERQSMKCLCKVRLP